MQKGHCLNFECRSCARKITFTVFNLRQELVCPHCGLIYDFQDETLQRQLKKFEALCRQIQESQEILSSTGVGVRIGDREVQIPYKILLSRFNSSLTLSFDGHPLIIQFRTEPAEDFQSFQPVGRQHE